jgi:hypothetical protein
MEDDGAKMAFATNIVIEAGVLRECEYHIDSFKVTGRSARHAYTWANAKFPSGTLPQGFSSRREMTDLIEKAIDNNYYPGGQCPRCDHLRDRD